MRRQHHVVERKQRVVRFRRLLVEDVEPRPRDLPRGQRLGERDFVDDRAAARVDEHRARLEEGDLAGADEVAGGRVEGNVERDDVGGSQELSEQPELDPEGVLRILAEPGDVVVVHGHAERAGEPCGLLADGAEPDDAEGPAPELVHPRRLVAAPAAAPHVRMLEGQAPAHREHQQQRMLGHRDRVGAPVVRERHAGPARRRDVRAVVARAQQLDELELRGGAIEPLLDEPVDETDEVARLSERFPVRGSSGPRLHQLEPGRSQLRDRLAVVEGRVDVHDSGFHSVPPMVHRIRIHGSAARAGAGTIANP